MKAFKKQDDVKKKYSKSLKNRELEKISNHKNAFEMYKSTCKWVILSKKEPRDDLWTIFENNITEIFTENPKIIPSIDIERQQKINK